MNIHVKDLDLGYKQCASILSLINGDGKSLVDRLERNILNLKKNWIGNDAKVHINNLIQVYTTLAALLSEGKVTIAEAASRIIAIQNVRNANAGGAGSVGQELDRGQVKTNMIAQVADTTEYNVLPGAVQDLTDLTNIRIDFEKFSSNFEGDKSEFMNNWTEGADRSTAEKLFQKFNENSELYLGYLKNAETELGKAVQNIQKLNV